MAYTLELSYDGKVKEITALSDCRISYKLIGGGGGAGGTDSPYGGSDGVAGDTVTGTIALSKGEKIYIMVGSGGTRGTSSTGGGGGAGGYSLDGYSGGTGGNAGPSGWSGGGGGGGGATLIWKMVGAKREILAIAAGGGGGGGGGHYSAGYIKSNSPYGYTVIQRYYPNAAYIAGIPAGGRGPSLGNGVLNPDNFQYYPAYNVYGDSQAQYPTWLQSYLVRNTSSNNYLTWQIYFPYTGQYKFAAAYFGKTTIFIDDVNVPYNPTFTGQDEYGNPYTYTLPIVPWYVAYTAQDIGVPITVTQGWHTLKIQMQKYPGYEDWDPEGNLVSFQILNNKNAVLTSSRAPYNPQSIGASWNGSTYVDSTVFQSTNFNVGVFPILKKMYPYNSAPPTQDMVVVGKNVTQSKLSAYGITTPVQNLRVVKAGDIIKYSTSGYIDDFVRVCYWIWNTGLPIPSNYTIVQDEPHHEGDRNYFSMTGPVTIPSGFTDDSILVFGIGDVYGLGGHAISFNILWDEYETRGGKGQNHQGDGGGPGGGGGGNIGGQGGMQPSGDVGAMSGSNGTSYAPTKADYVYNVSVSYENSGKGGIASVSGSGYSGYAGIVTVDSNINVYTKSYVNTGSFFKPNYVEVIEPTKVTEVYYRQNNQWIAVKEAYAKVNNQWVSLYRQSSSQPVDVTGYTINNTSGSMTPYPPPPPPPLDYWY